MFVKLNDVPDGALLESALSNLGLRIAGTGCPRAGQLFLGRDSWEGRRSILRATSNYPVPTHPALQILFHENEDGIPLQLDADGWASVIRGDPGAYEVRHVIERKIQNQVKVTQNGVEISWKDLPWQQR